MIKANCFTCNFLIEFKDRRDKGDKRLLQEPKEYCPRCKAVSEALDKLGPDLYEWLVGVAKRAGEEAVQNHRYQHHYKENGEPT